MFQTIFFQMFSLSKLHHNTEVELIHYLCAEGTPERTILLKGPAISFGGGLYYQQTPFRESLDFRWLEKHFPREKKLAETPQ